MDPAQEDFQPPLGSRAGPYKLLQVLGRSYTGIVYLGVTYDGSRVAIKMLRGPGHNKRVYKEKLSRLGRTCSAPAEACVVRLVEGWQDEELGGCYCLCMTPPCEGGSLEAMMQTSAAPKLTLRLQWALEVAETLLLLHGNPSPYVRPFHGNVTPRKVAFCPTAEGLEAHLLDPHSIRETPEDYSSSVAPEAVDLLLSGGDQSADVWSWGVLLHALLSWSLKRMKGGTERAWLASLSGQDRAAWEHELVREPGAGINEEGWVSVVDLMVDCLRPRQERVGMETVVHVMRRALGYEEAPSRIVALDMKLREQRAEGGWAPEDVVSLLRSKADAHERLEQFMDVQICLEQAVSLGRSQEVTKLGFLACCVTHLAFHHDDRKNYEQARPLYEEALALWRAAYPPGDMEVAKSIHNLARFYQTQGLLKEAQPLYEEALAIRREVLQPGHEDIKRTVIRLVQVLEGQGKGARARALEKGIRRPMNVSARPSFHIPFTLRERAARHAQQGDNDHARSLYEEALAMQRAVLPPDHPDIACHTYMLACFYTRTGSGGYEKAWPLFEEALALWRRALPTAHPIIVLALNNLYACHMGRGQAARATPGCEEGLARRRRLLPAGHLDIAIALDRLALMFQKQGEYAKARPLFEEALAIRRVALYPSHPDIATSLAHLAGLDEELRDFAPARRMYEEALAVRRAALPPSHSHIRQCIICLAALHRDQGEYEQARVLYEEALAVSRVALYSSHPDIATCLHSLARVHLLLDERERAVPLYEEALAIMRAVPAPGHPDISFCLVELVTLHKCMRSSSTE